MSGALIEQVASRIYNVPLLITPEKMNAIMSVITRGEFSSSGIAFDGQLKEGATKPAARKPRTSGVKGIAIIPVIGSLVARSSGFGSGSGLRSYISIKRDLKSAMNDPDIGGVMIDADSHGGEVAGCFALADFIRECTATKPIYCHVNESAYSAMYALASACERIFVSPTSGAGSIGVVMQHMNQSKWNKKIGLEVEYIYSGARKVDGNPHNQLSKEVRALLQDKVDTLRGMFAEKVDIFRGLKSGAALATEAACYMGGEIVNAGLADEAATWEEALEQLSAKINQSTGGIKMTTKERMAALIDNNDDAAEALADLGFIPKASQPQRVDFDYEAIAKGLGLSAEQVGGDYAKINFLAIGSALEQKGFSRAKAEDKQMFDMCALAGAPEMAGPVMEQAKSIDAARELILNEKAVIDSKSSITSTISGDKPQNDFVSFMQKQHAPAQA